MINDPSLDGATSLCLPQCTLVLTHSLNPWATRQHMGGATEDTEMKRKRERHSGEREREEEEEEEHKRQKYKKVELIKKGRGLLPFVIQL